MTTEIRSRLRRDEEVSPLIDVIIPVELMAVGYNLMKLKVTLDEAWVLLTMYDSPILPKDIPMDLLSRLRLLMSSYSGERNWLNLLEQYKDVKSYQRLINLNQDHNFTFNTPRLDPNRRKLYENILLQPIPYKSSDKVYANPGKFFYYKHLDRERVKMSGRIPQSWIKQVPQLKQYRHKQDIHFSLDDDWIKIAQEMDNQLSPAKREWVERIRPIAVKSINKAENIFYYKGLQHIAGGLASGKSTFRMIQTYWLVTKQSAKVGMIEGSVADVLKTVSRLRALGINARPIIGKSHRNKHLNNYLLEGKFKTIDQLTDPQLKHLSGLCTLKSLAKDFDQETNPFYPCEYIFTEGKTPKLCPLIHQCGIYQDWVDLRNADVWVTTAAAVLKTTIPATIDPYKRTIYEAMYDLLDVIFVDEADQVQKQFEEAFLTEYSAFGQQGYLAEKLYQQFNENIQHDSQLLGNTYVSEWEMNLHHLQENARQLRARLKTSRRLRSMLKRQVIYLNYLIHRIADTIAWNESDYEVKKRALLDYVKHATFRNRPSKHNHLQLLIRTTNEWEKLSLVKEWIHQVSGEIPEDESELRQLRDQIELFVYLANIESALKHIKYFYPMIRQITRVENIPVLSMVSDFRPLVKEAMTGVMFGYRYVQGDGKEIGHFNIIQYLAVGRDLLYRWHDIYEAADSRRGPALVLLSGTSYAPKSLHYHIDEEPGWFITSTRQRSQLKQGFLKVNDPDNDEQTIHISGVRSLEQRHNNLIRLVKELELKIADELSYWQKKNEDRKVLLVVNSYDDVEVVGKALQQSTYWKGRYRLLSRENRRDNSWFPRSLIELFPGEQADILVAPMLAISRGYNIMKEQAAYFGSAFFLIRPYPVPNDLSYFVQVLHGHLPEYFKDIKENEEGFVRAMRSIRQRSRSYFEYMYKKPGYWSVLSERERLILAWYTFIPTWQLIGRLLRGGSHARVFYCDGKFTQATKSTPSMLDYWQKIMVEADDNIFNSLYGPFKESIKNIQEDEVYIF